MCWSANYHSELQTSSIVPVIACDREARLPAMMGSKVAVLQVTALCTSVSRVRPYDTPDPNQIMRISVLEILEEDELFEV